MDSDKKANLGLATTRDLLNELTARIDVLGLLDYSTVGGVPAAAPNEARFSGLGKFDTETSGNINVVDQVVADERPVRRVVRTKTTADRVYYIDEDKGTRQWVTNPEVLANLGFSMEDVKEIDDDEMLKYQQSQALYRVAS